MFGIAESGISRKQCDFFLKSAAKRDAYVFLAIANAIVIAKSAAVIPKYAVPIILTKSIELALLATIWSGVAAL